MLVNGWHAECVDVVSHKNAAISCMDSLDSIIVTGAEDAKVRVWDSEGMLVRDFVAHRDRINDLILHADAARNVFIATASSDSTARVWDIKGWNTQVLEGHSQAVQSISVDCNTRTVTGGLDGEIRVWSSICDVPDGILPLCNPCLLSFQCDVYIYRVCALGSSKHVASGDADGIIRVWNIDDSPAQLSSPVLTQLGLCDEDCVLKGHQAAVMALCVGKNNRLVSGDAVGAMRV